MRKTERRSQIYALQRSLIGDSRLRERELKRLLGLVREEERDSLLERRARTQAALAQNGETTG